MLKALAITGPTASGKTALSLDVAERLGCEIISCDSMQIYKEMNIGTAKATKEEQARVPHFMIDIISPTENFSAESYRSMALECAREISSRGKIPLFVGGTGLYIDTVMRGAELSSPGSDSDYREKILSEIKTEEDRIALWKRLSEIDPESAEKTHYNNLKRVIRALEIYDKTGKPKSAFDKESKNISPDISVGMITLDFLDRENLYLRVDKRVDIMMKEGLLSEVDSLYKNGLLPCGSTAAQAIGYKEIISAIEGKCTLEEATEQIKLSTRRYAKRQLTWFRHEKEARRIFVDDSEGMRDYSEVLAEALCLCKKFLEN
jgi:tRNA dimethylallyltransferase